MYQVSEISLNWVRNSYQAVVPWLTDPCLCIRVSMLPSSWLEFSFNANNILDIVVGVYFTPIPRISGLVFDLFIKWSVWVHYHQFQSLGTLYFHCCQFETRSAYFSRKYFCIYRIYYSMHVSLHRVVLGGWNQALKSISEIMSLFELLDCQFVYVHKFSEIW